MSNLTEAIAEKGEGTEAGVETDAGTGAAAEIDEEKEVVAGTDEEKGVVVEIEGEREAEVVTGEEIDLILEIGGETVAVTEVVKENVIGEGVNYHPAPDTWPLEIQENIMIWNVKGIWPEEPVQEEQFEDLKGRSG